MAKKHERRKHSHFDFGNWFLIYRPFLSIMKADAAVLLCFLINQQQRWSNDPDAWFYCKVETVESATGMVKRRQADVLQSLIQSGFIRTEKRGQPAKRHVRVMYEALERAVRVVFLSETSD